jgi:hypothetical protein
MWMRDGLRKFQHKDVEFSKISYKLRLPGVEIKSGRKRPYYSHKFKTLGHWLHSDPHLVLVHYLGDETIYKPMAHGNSKHETEFKRTMSSVIDKMKSEEGGVRRPSLIHIYWSHFQSSTFSLRITKVSPPFGFTGGKVITLLLSGLLKMLTITSLSSSVILLMYGSGCPPPTFETIGTVKVDCTG